MDFDPKSVFVSKYAPSQLSDVVFADDAVEAAIRRYVVGQDLRPLILYGPNGTGKSTLARLLPIAMEAKTGPSDIHEYNPILGASPKTAKSILEGVQYRSLYGGTKTYILEELDLFPEKIVNILKCAMDVAEGQVLFIATTNDVNALDKGHRSRAVCLPINQPPLERWMLRVKAILDAEGVPIPKKAVLAKMLENSRGDNREFLSDLQRYVEIAKSVPMGAD